MNEATCVPNHHADFPGFRGLFGLTMAVFFSFGREPDAKLAADLGRVADGDTVLDIGCGPGTAARHAASLGATVVGIDPAPMMLRVARVLTRGRRVRYLDGTAEQLPLADASANVAWSIATVHHWQDIDAGLRELRRVLAPGGRFVALEGQSEPGAHGHASHGWTRAQAKAFAARCTELGFETVRVDEHEGGRRPTYSVVAVAP